MKRPFSCCAGALALLLLAAGPDRAAAVTLRVTSTGDEGAGTLREAIEAANREPGSRIEVALGREATIFLLRQLPPLRAEGLVLDGGGATLREGDDCLRPGGRKGCDGIVVAGPGIEVRNLAATGFLFDGFAVRTPSARDVLLQGIQSLDNQDDGVGVSEGAGPVVVKDALLMGNGYRTKGKGLLAYDGARVELRSSVLVGNRDGITATQGSSVVLHDVFVAGSYDKGIGVSAALVQGARVRVLANGRGFEGRGKAPNGDGLRAGLGGRIELEDSRIAGNGDSGVAVLEGSAATLRRVLVEGNLGRPTAVAAGGSLRVE